MNWKIGDGVYSVQTYSGVEKGTITKLVENGAYIHFNSGGNGGARFGNMFSSEEEAHQHMIGDSKRIENEYREQLVTEEDVLRFIFNNCGSFEEYTNHEANVVGIEKVKEMFGVDID